MKNRAPQLSNEASKLLAGSTSIWEKKPEVARERGLVAQTAGKIKNMAEENIEEVFLTPDDIAGAAVKDEEIGKLTVNQLKFWLKCRRINLSGNEQALYERLSSCFACCFVLHSRIRLFHFRNPSSVSSFRTG